MVRPRARHGGRTFDQYTADILVVWPSREDGRSFTVVVWLRLAPYDGSLVFDLVSERGRCANGGGRYDPASRLV